MKNTESMQSLGGKARAKALSPEKRKEIAQRAAAARWNFPKSTHEGLLVIGKFEITCAVLDDGTRVISESNVTKTLGGKRGGAHWRRMKKNPDGANLPVYLSANNLNMFIDNDLELALREPLIYLPKTGRKGYGLKAKLLPQICNVFLKARDDRALHPSQFHIARQADLLMRGLAEIGIIALIDEATGYQNERAKRALAEILERFIAKELQAWTKTFPDDFYREIFRLKGWRYDPASVRRPSVIGHYTNDIVYNRLAPGVLDELKKKEPSGKPGRRKHKLFQWLTGDVGHPKLKSHLDGVIALMKASQSNDWMGFRQLLKRAFPKIETTELGFEIALKEKK